MVFLLSTSFKVKVGQNFLMTSDSTTTFQVEYSSRYVLSLSGCLFDKRRLKSRGTGHISLEGSVFKCLHQEVINNISNANSIVTSYSQY